MASSGNSFYGFRFRVGQGRPSPAINAHPNTADEVAIEFRVTVWQRIEKFIAGDDRPVSVAPTRSPTRVSTFWVPKHVVLLRDGGALMSSLLLELSTPAEHCQAVLRDISLAAAAASRSRGTGTTPIVVALEHMTVVHVEVDDDDADEPEDVMNILLRESMAVDVVRPIPAARSAIKRLEKVTFEDGLGSIGECIICIEKFEGGLELTRLPCSHVYHGDCIVKWLETSRLCPLCRYPLPPVHGEGF